MDEESTVNLDTPNEAADETLLDEQVSDTDNNDSDQTTADVEIEMERLKKQNQKLFERAKTAEGFIKNERGEWVKKPQPIVSKPPEAKPESSSLTFFDQMALMDANVKNKEDFEEVVEYATRKSIPVADALKTPFIKTFLKEREEERKSAQVANTSGSKRGSSSKVSPDQVLINAEKGIAPKTDDEWDALVRARTSLKK